MELQILKENKNDTLYGKTHSEEIYFFITTVNEKDYSSLFKKMFLCDKHLKSRN
jgi:hypothetical protein